MRRTPRRSRSHMSLPELPPLREVVQRHGLIATKALGQNFLFDEQLLARMVGQPDNAQELALRQAQLTQYLHQLYRDTFTDWSRRHAAEAEEVRRLVLTASGGPFRGRSRADLATVTVEQALAHPWVAGEAAPDTALDADVVRKRPPRKLTDNTPDRLRHHIQTLLGAYLGATLHVRVLAGRDRHHLIEAGWKAPPAISAQPVAFAVAGGGGGMLAVTATGPGAIALTRMSGANSRARERVSPITPALAAQ